MKKTGRLILGLVLIAAGIIFILNATGIANINVFFDGWWTLFLIVPGFVGLFTQKDKTGNLICLAIGIFLLLCCQDILSFDMLWKLALPTILIIIGLKIIFSGFFTQKAPALSADAKNGCAIFAGQTLRYDNEVFPGAELNAIFGGVKCDLTLATFETDCTINATAIFGGIDILLPPTINVKVNSTSLFGGVSKKTGRNMIPGAPTLYINGTGIFGGVDIK